jgi:uncharacterized membrane protein (DUF485 family)
MSSTAGPTPMRPESEPVEWDEDAARRRIRVVLTASALLLVLVMLLPVLTSFTHVLNGVVAGVGVAYVVGFGEFVIAMAGAVAYCRWVNRIEAAGPSRPEPHR